MSCSRPTTTATPPSPTRGRPWSFARSSPPFSDTTPARAVPDSRVAASPAESRDAHREPNVPAGDPPGRRWGRRRHAGRPPLPGKHSTSPKPRSPRGVNPRGGSNSFEIESGHTTDLQTGPTTLLTENISTDYHSPLDFSKYLWLLRLDTKPVIMRPPKHLAPLSAPCPPLMAPRVPSQGVVSPEPSATRSRTVIGIPPN